mmetsp:Transcript_31417/g.76653  ORF Transcript_31417/g.76653 Transcript_31417/m.76653 type:complete len:120 (+) Transcript_31417:350-709(+)
MNNEILVVSKQYIKKYKYLLNILIELKIVIHFLTKNDTKIDNIIKKNKCKLLLNSSNKFLNLFGKYINFFSNYEFTKSEFFKYRTHPILTNGFISFIVDYLNLLRKVFFSDLVKIVLKE